MNWSTILLACLCTLAAVFLFGLALSFGVWLGYGAPAARADRRLAAYYQERKEGTECDS